MTRWNEGPPFPGIKSPSRPWNLYPQKNESPRIKTDNTQSTLSPLLRLSTLTVWLRGTKRRRECQSLEGVNLYLLKTWGSTFSGVNYRDFAPFLLLLFYDSQKYIPRNLLPRLYFLRYSLTRGLIPIPSSLNLRRLFISGIFTRLGWGNKISVLFTEFLLVPLTGFQCVDQVPSRI